MLKHVVTLDGSSTVFSDEYNEHYHSCHGALMESKFIFIDQGLKYFIEKNDKESVSIFEMGLGTALNPYLTLLESVNRNIEYTVVESKPISQEIISQLDYKEIFVDESSKDLFYKLHQCPWNEFNKINPQFNFRKLLKRLEDYEADTKFDVIYYDAFSSKTQPELWTEEIFSRIFKMCNPNAVLVTYSSRVEVRNNLKNAGFYVEKLAGPPGKRNITRAIVSGK